MALWAVSGWAQQPAPPTEAKPFCPRHSAKEAGLLAEKSAIEARPESEQKQTDLAYVKKELANLDVQMIACGCRKGSITDLPSTGGTDARATATPGGQSAMGAALGAQASGYARYLPAKDDFWVGTWRHRYGELTLDAPHDTMELSSMLTGYVERDVHGPAVPTNGVFYAGTMKWRGGTGVPPGDWTLSVRASSDGGNLYGSYSSIKFMDKNPNALFMGRFTVSRIAGSDPPRFQGTFEPMEIDPSQEFQTYRVRPLRPTSKNEWDGVKGQ